MDDVLTDPLLAYTRADDQLAHANAVLASSTFVSHLPITLQQFQEIVLRQMHDMSGLLRAKGVIWFSNFRSCFSHFPSEPLFVVVPLAASHLLVKQPLIACT